MSLLPANLGTSEPNWIVTAIIGAILGTLVGPISGLLAFPFRRLARHPLNGRWYSYHRTFLNGEVILRYGTFHVRPGILHSHTVTRRSSAQPADSAFKLTRPILQWRGHVYDELDHFVMIFTAKSHVETMMYRTMARLPSNNRIIPVLWIGYDHDVNPAVGVGVLSREPLDDDRAIELMRSWFIAEEGALRLRKEGRST